VWVSLEEIKPTVLTQEFWKGFFIFHLPDFFQMLIHMIRQANTKN